MPDFTNCPIIKGKAYGGANGSKIPIEFCGEQYMLKFPSSGENKQTELSYTNGCVSEYIGSHIFNQIGIKAHDTILGTYKTKEKEKTVVACKDFTSDGRMFYDFASIKNTIIDSEHSGAGTELSSIMEAIEKQNFVDPQELKEFFWDTFVVDAFIGNFDRHNGNWGFLVDQKTGESSIAPVFDCGSCLLPQADIKTMEKVLSNPDELDRRIYVFPTSAIKLDGKKINYFDFMMSGNNKDCSKAILRVAPLIQMSEVKDIIDQTPYITGLQKEFYQGYIGARYEKIIEPAYSIAQKSIRSDINEQGNISPFQEIFDGINELNEKIDHYLKDSDSINDEKKVCDHGEDISDIQNPNLEIEEDFGAI